ncbi:MAG: hypothetical protein V1822_00040, partial [Candidatus Micrarchaeota archaeon]
MQSMADQLEAQMGKDEFEPLVSKKLEEYFHLIGLQTARYLVALERLGVSAGTCNIEQGKVQAAPCILHVRLKRIFLPQIYKRGVQESRTQRIEVEDESGTCIVALYDEVAKMIDSAALCHDIVKIGPLKFRGGEFHSVSSSHISRLEKGLRTKLSDTRMLLANFEGKITEMGGDFTYGSPSNGKEKEIATSFEIEDSSAKARVVFWNSGGIEKTLKKGMEVEIENGVR